MRQCNFRQKLRLILAYSVSGGVMTSYPVMAQEADATEDDFVSDEIVVTARKREENLRDVPVAISAFSGDTISGIGAQNLDDFLQNAPGVNIADQGTGLSEISVRGVSTTLGGNANGYYLDGVPFTGVTVPLNPDVRTFDIERVEVLRGPQGTLFGDGSMGGTIRILTKNPDLEDFQITVGGTYADTKGGESSYGIRGMVNVPIVSGKLAIRAVAMQEEDGGWIDSAGGSDDVNQSKMDNYRIKLLFAPTERLEIIASYWDYRNVHDGSNLAFDDGSTVPNPQSGLSEYDRTSVQVKYNVSDDGQLFYAFGKTDFRNVIETEIPSLGDLVADINIDVETHEFLYSDSFLERLNITLGGYTRKADRTDNIDLPPVINNARNDVVDGYAIFGEAEYRFSDQLRVSAGLRYFNEDIDTVDSDLAGATIRASEDTFNPRFTVTYQPSERWTVYASAAKGFRSAQAQPGSALTLGPLFGFTGLPQVLSSDTIWTYELGAKGVAAGGKVFLEGSIYKSDWQNPIVRLDLAGSGLNGLQTAPGIDITGAEFSIVVAATEGLNVTAGASYIDGEFTADVPNTPILAGDRITNVSEFTANLAIDYSAEISDQLTGTAHIGASFATDRVDTSFVANAPGDDILLLDARFGIEHETWGIYVFGDNLTDENGAINARTPLGAVRPRPRTFGVELLSQF
ncbi:MAG: TonB-dependent receptor [Pseudomonadota bacterium]